MMTVRFFPAAILFALVVAACACRYEREGSVGRDGMPERSAGPFVRRIWIDSAGGAASSAFLAIVVYFENLGCMPCLLSLRELSEAILQNQHTPECKKIILLIARTRESYALQRRKMEAWAEANGLKFPLCLVDADSLRENLIVRSSAVLVDSSGEVEVGEAFPVSPEVSAQIIRRLSVK